MGSVKGKEIKVELALYADVLRAENEMDKNIIGMKTQATSLLKFLDDAFSANAQAQILIKKVIDLEKQIGNSNGSSEKKLQSILQAEKVLMNYRSSISNIR